MMGPNGVPCAPMGCYAMSFLGFGSRLTQKASSTLIYLEGKVSLFGFFYIGAVLFRGPKMGL